ncbi:MAG: DUF4864 domain-containing protein [Pseudomonadota bacterium]|nr:DUF4864 domain-containing protein [Pseudomonadota bacterium]
MTGWRTRWWCWLSVLWLGAAALAQPALSTADAEGIRSTVQSQLSAMATGDAERAFALAAPGIRQQFGNAGAFMAMVRSAYPMVIKPSTTTFFVPVGATEGASQQVRLVDAAGRLWLASYALARQTDGTWRIAGCSVALDNASHSI